MAPGMLSGRVPRPETEPAQILHPSFYHEVRDFEFPCLDCPDVSCPGDQHHRSCFNLRPELRFHRHVVADGFLGSNRGDRDDLGNVREFYHQSDRMVHKLRSILEPSLRNGVDIHCYEYNPKRFSGSGRGVAPVRIVW